MRLSLLLICCCLSLTFLKAQERYIDDLFSEVEKSTYEYANKDGESLKLDVYQPIGDKASDRAAIIWMHGGGFAGGKRDNGAEVKFMEIAAKKGFVAVSISYRLTRKGKSFSCDAPRNEKMETFRLASKDLWDAIYYIASNDKQFKIDPSKLIIGGSSAGAEGILNAVYMRDWLYEGPSKYHTIQPLALFSLAGAMIDARYINSDNAVPAVFFHGTDDNLVPYATAPHHYCKASDIGYIWLDGSRTIADKLKSLNTSYLLYTFTDARHEISSMPFDYLDHVFEFLSKIIHGKTTVQEEITIKKK